MSTPSDNRPHIAVIGGGWSGCSAAVTLTQKKYRVTVFESARVLGGRARKVTLTTSHSMHPVTLDNGQHILLGAYKATLGLMKTVGLCEKDTLLRLPLQMCYPPNQGMHFVTSRLPAPWHLIAALIRTTGLLREDKMALAHFSTSARWMGWHINEDYSVAQLLVQLEQTDRLIALLWEPLCIAALNTPIQQASAQTFLHVLRDSLGARRRHASEMLIPRVNLSALFPEQAASFVTHHGGTIMTGTAIQSITAPHNGHPQWQVSHKDSDAPVAFDGVVVATSPDNAAQLLEDSIDVTALRQLTYEPITTCYLQYTPDVVLARPFYALLNSVEDRTWGQFVFDRGQQSHEQAGLLAVVISTSRQAIERGHDVLVQDVILQLQTALQMPALATPLWTKVISEKRATFACTPGLIRPENLTEHDTLVLAGDYTAGPYPATIEAAVQSGIDAATHLMGQLR